MNHDFCARNYQEFLRRSINEVEAKIILSSTVVVVDCVLCTFGECEAHLYKIVSLVLGYIGEQV